MQASLSETAGGMDASAASPRLARSVRSAFEAAQLLLEGKRRFGVRTGRERKKGEAYARDGCATAVDRFARS